MHELILTSQVILIYQLIYFGLQNALLYNNNIQFEYIICIFHFWKTTKKNYERLRTGLHDRHIA